MEMKKKFEFDLNVKELFLCPNCKTQKEWAEVICKKCGYDEFCEEFVNQEEKK
jgi:hypothetical protein